jgi:hypothetical protein
LLYLYIIIIFEKESQREDRHKWEEELRREIDHASRRRFVKWRAGLKEDMPVCTIINGSRIIV